MGSILLFEKMAFSLTGIPSPERNNSPELTSKSSTVLVTGRAVSKKKLEGTIGGVFQYEMEEKVVIGEIQVFHRMRQAGRCELVFLFQEILEGEILI